MPVSLVFEFLRQMCIRDSYVADRIALLANLRERCLWGGDTRKFHTQFGVGIKVTKL